MYGISLTDDPDLNIVPGLDWREEIEKMERPVVVDLGRVDGYVKITVDYMGHPEEYDVPLLKPKFANDHSPLDSRVALVKIYDPEDDTR